MERIGIRELRRHASRLGPPRQGRRELEVTDLGRPVARLVPPATAEGIERLRAEGRTTPARGDLLDTWPPLAARPGVPLPSEIVEAMRSEER